MDLWYPPDDQEPLLEWWTPLLMAAATARREQVPWPIHFEDFELQGRVDRGARPAVWVYKHVRSLQELYLDDLGRPYKFTRTPNGRSFGRFTSCNIRAAVHRAGLPGHVEPVWYEEPSAPPSYRALPLPLDEAEPWADEDRPHPPPSHARPRRRPRPGARRGHLTLIHGGRAAG